MKKPEINSAAQRELDQAEKQFEAFDNSVKEMTNDRLSSAPKEDSEMQTQMSSKDLGKSKDVYLKPKRTISSKEKFNEKFRKDWEFDKEYVQFIAENKEIIGETISLWTKPYAGLPAEEWDVPTNKPVWGPRHLAEQIKRCSYHRFVMENKPIESNHAGTMYGAMAVDTTVQRLDAYPVRERKSVFMNGSF